MTYQLMGLGSGNNQLVNSYHEFTQAASANSGNLLFNYAIERISVLTKEQVSWSTPSTQINDQGFNLLLPMANNIGPHMDINANGPKINDVNVSAVAMGLGVQFTLNDSLSSGADKVPPGTVKWLKTLASKSDVPNISVRGALTKSYIDSIGLKGKAVSLGCPSHLISAAPNLGEILATKSKAITEASLKNSIGITAGNPSIGNLHSLERFLIETLQQYGGSYVVQAPKPLICLAEGWLEQTEENQIASIHKNWFPKYTYEEMLSWFRQFSRTYISIPQWFRDVSKHEIVVGTRIHGCQLPLQAGVPAVCLYIDSRTKELCDTMCIPNMSAIEFQKAPSITQLLKIVKDWDWQKYDENRKRLAIETMDFLTENEIEPTSHMKRLAKHSR